MILRNWAVWSIVQENIRTFLCTIKKIMASSNSTTNILTIKLNQKCRVIYKDCLKNYWEERPINLKVKP